MLAVALFQLAHLSSIHPEAQPPFSKPLRYASVLRTSTLVLSAAPKPLRYADGIPKARQLSPALVRLRTAALRKPSPHVCLTKRQLACRPSTRAARLVRSNLGQALAPSNASDLVDSIPTRWSPRKRRIAVALVHAFAHAGIVVRSSTFAGLVRACRGAGELDEAEALLTRLHECSLRANPTVYVALMGEMCRAGRPEAAIRLEAAMVEAGARSTNESFAVLISSLLRAGRTDLAVDKARQVRASGQPFDLAVYHVLLQALLEGGTEGEAKSVLEDLRAAGHSPTSRTLNVLLKGFVGDGSLGAALEIFNTFCAAGGAPGLIAYNILIDAFARRGQMLNCESLHSQLQVQGLTPDVYTYNALIRAAVAADRPDRALAYSRLMTTRGTAPDSITLTLLTDAYIATGRPLAAAEAARAVLEATPPADGMLDRPLRMCLLSACALASTDRDEYADDAREQALWLRARSREEAAVARSSRWSGAGDGPRRRGKARFEPRRSEMSEIEMRDFIRTLGNANDLEGARTVFEQMPKPRPQAVWKEMVRLCNQCGETTFATELLRQLDGPAGHDG